MNSEIKCPSLTWTGERYLPEIAGPVELEHLHRYTAVLKLAMGKRVLDIASGEGYGSNMLSEVAQHVIGVDISDEAICHAQLSYQRSNLEFRLGSAAHIPVESNSIDLVVSFETIEHHEQHDEMMLEIKRILTADGVLVISSPNKHNYSIIPNYVNPYHVKELFTAEFTQLLKNHFSHVKLLGQRVVYGSLLAGEDDHASFVSLTKENDNKGLTQSRYDFALATNAIMPVWPNSFFEIPINKRDAATYLVEQIEKQNQLLMEHQQHAVGLQNSLKEHEEKLAQELAHNASLHTELNVIHAETQKILLEKDKVHAEAQKILLEKDKVHAEAQKILLEKDKIHAEAQKILLEKDRLNAELQKMHVEFHHQIMTYDEHMTQLNHDITQLNQTIINMTNSMSWYVTKPLRLISSYMRRFFAFFKLNVNY